MFMSTSKTMRQCLDKNIFGLPANMKGRMNAIGESTQIFLYNSDIKKVNPDPRD